MRRLMKFGAMFLIVAMLCAVSVGVFAADVTGTTSGHKITITSANIDRSNADVLSIDVGYSIDGDVTDKQITVLGYIFSGDASGDAADSQVPTQLNGVIRAIDQTAASTSGTVNFKLAKGDGSNYTITGNETMVVKFGTNVAGVESAQAFYLRLAPRTYTVTYDVGEYGVAVESDSVSELDTNKTITLPACGVQEGLENSQKFTGWLIDGVEYEAGDSYTISSSVTAVAQWEQLYAIKLVPGDGSGDEITLPNGYAIGDKVTMPANTFTAPGPVEGVAQVFDNWKIGETTYNVGADYSVSADDIAEGVVTVTAQWKNKPATFTVTYDANQGGGSIEPHTELDDGASVILKECTFTAPQGKEFKCWLVNGEEKNAGDTVTIEGNDVTVVAQWKDKPTYICGDTNMNGNVDGMDWQLILWHLNEVLITPELNVETSDEFLAADVNNSGAMDGMDWQLILWDLNEVLDTPAIGQPGIN